MSEVKADKEIVVEIEEDLEDIVPGYLENRARDVAALKAALKAADYEAVRVIGHTMKGTGGGYGFDELTDIGARLEAAGRSEDVERIEEDLFELADYLRRVRVLYVE